VLKPEKERALQVAVDDMAQTGFRKRSLALL
jgi:hypothetical protein